MCKALASSPSLTKLKITGTSVIIYHYVQTQVTSSFTDPVLTIPTVAELSLTFSMSSTLKSLDLSSKLHLSDYIFCNVYN